MGFISSLNLLRHSWKKSNRLRRLQEVIAPPGQTVDEFASAFLRTLESRSDGRKEYALKEVFDLCESDPSVRKVIEMECLSRGDLEELYHSFLKVGLGQWVKGHYVALSTIAYAEPLLYSVRARKRGVDLRHIAITLLDYWEDKFSPGDLLKKV